MRTSHVLSILFFVLISIYSFALTNVLHPDGKPTQLLIDLLALTNVQHDGTLASIVQATQKEWLRSPGKERWEIPEIFADKRNAFFSIFQKLNLIEAIKPTHLTYRYALVLGATVLRMRNRMAYLVEQWQHGVRFEKILFLAGQRLLDPVLEHSDVLVNAKKDQAFVRCDWKKDEAAALPATEAEAAKLVYDQVDIPDDLKKVPISFLTAPMVTMPNGQIRRPGTDEIIKLWLSTKPEPGTCVAFSNQPYCRHQGSVLQTLIPSPFAVETVGRHADDNTTIAVHLDNLARYLFSEGKRLGG